MLVYGHYGDSIK